MCHHGFQIILLLGVDELFDLLKLLHQHLPCGFDLAASPLWLGNIDLDIE